MAWLTIYSSVSVAVLAVLTFCYSGSIRGDVPRLLAVVAAAALWPVMVLGVLQYGVVRALAACLDDRTPAAPAAEPEPATIPQDFTDSLTRLVEQINSARPA